VESSGRDSFSSNTWSVFVKWGRSALNVIQTRREEQLTVSTEYLSRAFASTRSILAAVEPSQLHAPTPCVSWDVGVLIDHFVGTARWWASVIAADEGLLTGDIDSEDRMANYDTNIAVALEAFGSDGALERAVELPFGELPGTVVLGLAAIEQFTHGWDLARATGQSTDLDPALAEDLLALARHAILGEYRGPNEVALFGPIVDPANGDCPADQLAAFLGRSA
jgi:uncharacterized protein (TIGR03086 family)